MRRINLDYNATTPLLPEVRDAMLEVMNRLPGNPSSLHREGRCALKVMENARQSVAGLIKVPPEEVVFTSGGTEANTLALRGTLHRTGGTLVISAIEHPSVIETASHLEKRGYTVHRVPPDSEGLVSPESVKECLGDGHNIVSLMLANNETGTLQPVGELCNRLGGGGLVIHTDAVQAAGKIPVNPRELGVQLMTLSAHKMGGPKGVGLLWVDPNAAPQPILYGGDQEKGFRAGTQNVIGIVGFGRAAELAIERLSDPGRSCIGLRDRLETGILDRIPGAVVMGGKAERVPNTSYIAFENMEGTALVQLLDLKGIAASTGAACEAGSDEYSHVLRAMNIQESFARGAVRFSLGVDARESEIDDAIKIIVETVEEMKCL